MKRIRRVRTLQDFGSLLVENLKTMCAWLYLLQVGMCDDDWWHLISIFFYTKQFSKRSNHRYQPLRIDVKGRKIYDTPMQSWNHARVNERSVHIVVKIICVQLDSHLTTGQLILANNWTWLTFLFEAQSEFIQVLIIYFRACEVAQILAKGVGM